jgi:LCP family protein required for cell wall assembly
MDEEKPRARPSSAYNNSRRNFFIDGVSRPLPPKPSGDDPQRIRKPDRPLIGQSPKPSSTVAERDLGQKSSPITNLPLLNNQASARPVAPNRNPQMPSLIGTALPASGLAGHSRHSLPRRKSVVKRALKYSAITLILAIIGFGSWFGSSVIGSLDKAFHGNVFSDVHALVSGTTLKESNGRINILLAGDSVDDPHHQGALLADSIMVISYDPTTKNGFILSIPRDLWVDIPGWNHEKINAANDVTTFSKPGYPSGGIGQLQEIVQTDLGIPIDYEATIDYSALRDAVNTVGGITVNIQSSDPYGIYDSYTHLKLPNGEDTLNGQQALDLARSRGDGPGSYGIPNADFSRTQFQREMLIALAKKSLSVGVLTNPIKIASLFNSLGNNITTNLSLGDVTSMLHLISGLKLSNIQSAAYSYGGTNPMLIGYLAPNGEDALIPALGVDNFTALKAYYQQLVSSTTNTAANAAAATP